MLRYRESLGLLPANRVPGAHRRYDEESLRAAAYAITLEQSYDVSPSALAFALRVLTDPVVNSDVRRLSELTGPGSSSLAALDFDQEKARRLLRSPNSILPGVDPRPGRRESMRGRPAPAGSDANGATCRSP